MFILLGVLRTETSGFSQEAVSHAGAVGVAQLLPIAVVDVGGDWERAKASWRDNLQYGVSYLRLCRSRTNNWKEAIVAYNWGISHVDEYRRGVITSETVTYLKNVFSY